MNPLAVPPSQLDELMQRLTPRQMQIVELLAEGLDYASISNILSISSDAVRKHVYHACYKLELDNRVQLIVMYACWKVIKNN